MQSLLSDSRKLFGYMLAWLVAGAFIAKLLTVAGLVPEGGPAAWFFAIPITIVYGFVAASAYHVCRALPPARRGFEAAIAMYASSTLLAGLVWLGLWHGWNTLGQAIGEDWARIAFPESLDLPLFGIGCGLYLLSLLGHDALLALETARTAEKNEAESRLLARDAELQVLRSQINPHFLFNSLNSISALTSIDPALARDMTVELAQFFRQTLALSGQEKIVLSREVALCGSYLAIEQIRFGKKLRSGFEIEAVARQALIPPMLLQPLVENAVKHGIRDLDDGGTVTVRAITRNGWLHIEIENPFDPDPDNPNTAPGTGTGLSNTRQRLAAAYGGRARATWTKTARTFLVEIAIPHENAG